MTVSLIYIYAPDTTDNINITYRNREIITYSTEIGNDKFVL
jgi:hypothetical protein